ncbi:Uncharacterized protein pbN1_12120 [Aromatoleum bremense]|nr:Uncharacterized protein pbN1_12120 [Aromatoleum bremense]
MAGKPIDPIPIFRTYIPTGEEAMWGGCGR